eukprot:gene40222-49739_t
MDFHIAIICPETLVDCPLFAVNCCGPDCAGSVKLGVYQQHIDEHSSSTTTEQLLKRLADTQLELTRATKRQRVDCEPSIANAVEIVTPHVIDQDDGTSVERNDSQPDTDEETTDLYWTDTVSSTAERNEITENPLKQSGLYTGERNAAGQRHGHGRQEYTHGRGLYYEGDWVNDKRHGHGKMKTRGHFGSLYVVTGGGGGGELVSE